MQGIKSIETLGHVLVAIKQVKFLQSQYETILPAWDMDTAITNQEQGNNLWYPGVY